MRPVDTSLLVREGINLSLGSTWISAEGKRDKMESGRMAVQVAIEKGLAATGRGWLKLRRHVLVINLFLRKTHAPPLFLVSQSSCLF